MAVPSFVGALVTLVFLKLAEDKSGLKATDLVFAANLLGVPFVVGFVASGVYGGSTTARQIAGIGAGLMYAAIWLAIVYFVPFVQFNRSLSVLSCVFVVEAVVAAFGSVIRSNM